MPTKDPHIAMIDAQKKFDRLKLMTEIARETLTNKVARGYVLTQDDRDEMARFRQHIIDETRRVQDELAEELQSHGKLDS